MQWIWTWANFERWWGTGRSGMLQSCGRKELDMSGLLNNSNANIHMCIHTSPHIHTYLSGSISLVEPQMNKSMWKMFPIYRASCTVLLRNLISSLRLITLLFSLQSTSPYSDLQGLTWSDPPLSLSLPLLPLFLMLSHPQFYGSPSSSSNITWTSVSEILLLMFPYLWSTVLPDINPYGSLLSFKWKLKCHLSGRPSLTMCIKEQLCRHSSFSIAFISFFSSDMFICLLIFFLSN